MIDELEVARASVPACRRCLGLVCAVPRNLAHEEEPRRARSAGRAGTPGRSSYVPSTVDREPGSREAGGDAGRAPVPTTAGSAAGAVAGVSAVGSAGGRCAATVRPRRPGPACAGVIDDDRHRRAPRAIASSCRGTSARSRRRRDLRPAGRRARALYSSMFSNCVLSLAILSLRELVLRRAGTAPAQPSAAAAPASGEMARNHAAATMHDADEDRAADPGLALRLVMSAAFRVGRRGTGGECAASSTWTVDVTS